MSRAIEFTSRSMRPNSFGCPDVLCIDSDVSPIREFAIVASVDSVEVVVVVGVVVATADAV